MWKLPSGHVFLFLKAGHASASWLGVQLRILFLSHFSVLEILRLMPSQSFFDFLLLQRLLHGSCFMTQERQGCPRVSIWIFVKSARQLNIWKSPGGWRRGGLPCPWCLFSRCFPLRSYHQSHQSFVHISYSTYIHATSMYHAFSSFI